MKEKQRKYNGNYSSAPLRIIWMTAATAATATSSGNTPSRDVIFRNRVVSHSLRQLQLPPLSVLTNIFVICIRAGMVHLLCWYITYVLGFIFHEYLLKY